MIAVEISLILCPGTLTTENPEGVSPFMCFTMGFLHVLMVTRCRRGNMNKHSKKHMIPLNPTKSHLKHQRVISKKTTFFRGSKHPFHGRRRAAVPRPGFTIAAGLLPPKPQRISFWLKDLVHQYFIEF